LEKRDYPNHPSPPFEEKEKEGEGRSKAWWPMEGKGEGFLLPYSHFSPKQLYLNLHFLSFDIKVLLYHGLSPLFTHSLPFLGL
jgi:hypothetical protein